MTYTSKLDWKSWIFISPLILCFTFGAITETVRAQDAPAVLEPGFTSPKAVITPDPEGVDQSYEIGDVGWLSAAGSDFEALIWDLSKAPAGTKVVDNLYVQFPTKKVGTNYAVGLTVAKYNITTKKPELAQCKFCFEIYTDDIPGPTPKPDEPGPKPDDTKPPEVKPTPAPTDDPFKAAIKAVNAKHTALPAEELPKVAVALRSVIKLIEEGKVTTKRLLVKAVADKMVEQIGVNAFEANWGDWRDDIFVTIRSLALTDMPSHTKPLGTIADVLEGK